MLHPENVATPAITVRVLVGVHVSDAPVAPVPLLIESVTWLVRRQLFLRIGDNYFSRLTTITLYSLAARSAGRQAQGEAPPAAVFFV
jgi:hypothetical protein